MQKLQPCISGQVNTLRRNRNLTRVYLSAGLRGFRSHIEPVSSSGLLGMGLLQVKYAERYKRSLEKY